MIFDLFTYSLSTSISELHSRRDNSLKHFFSPLSFSLFILLLNRLFAIDLMLTADILSHQITIKGMNYYFVYF